MSIPIRSYYISMLMGVPNRVSSTSDFLPPYFYDYLDLDELAPLTSLLDYYYYISYKYHFYLSLVK